MDSKEGSVESYQSFTEKKSFAEVRPDYLNCLPSFLNQLKHRGLASDELGGKILVQIAQRIFQASEQNQNEHYLLNMPSDFAALLTQADHNDVQVIINVLLDHLSEYEISLLLTHILKLEHIESPSDYARANSAAGRFITELSKRYWRDYCNNIMLPYLKRFETLVELNLDAFSRYAYSFRDNDSGPLSESAQLELTKILNELLTDIIRHQDQIPLYFRLMADCIRDINFLVVDCEVVIQDKIQTKNLKRNTFILIYGEGDSPSVQFWSSKKVLIPVDIGNDEQDLEALKSKNIKTIMPVMLKKRNDMLKLDRLMGLLNTRFFGFAISARSEELFNKETKLGGVMVHAMNKIFTESMRQLANYGLQCGDDYLKPFLTKENILRFQSFYQSIPYRRITTTPRAVDFSSVVSLEEQKITFISYLEDIFTRFHDLVARIQSLRQSVVESPRFKFKFKKTNEKRVLSIKLDQDLTEINGGRFCGLLNNIAHYSHTERELDKVKKLFQETMELALLFVFKQHVYPFVLNLKINNKNLKNHVEKIFSSKLYMLALLSLTQLLCYTDDHEIMPLKNTLEKDFKKGDNVSLAKFLSHTRFYEQLSDSKINLKEQVEILSSEFNLHVPDESFVIK